jgi:hypothetical protein
MAAGWSRPADGGAVEGRDLGQVTARGEIRDRVLASRPARASQAPTPTRVERYTDEHGHTILVGTTIPTLDLEPFAAVLAGTIHRAELSELRVLVIPPDQISAAWGAAAGVVACYGADDPARSNAGEMIVPSASPDLLHALVHEYGHHMDNSLLNLGHLEICDFASDGSRRWFFARDADDDIVTRSGCNDSTPYERQLAELYAEDYVALHGIDEWFVSAFPPPTARMLRALRSDIFRPFTPRIIRYRNVIRRPRRGRAHLLRLEVHTFFEARLTGPGGRRNDFDLFLYRRGGRRPIALSARRRSREHIERLLAPGRYEVVPFAYKGRGRYRLRVDAF